MNDDDTKIEEYLRNLGYPYVEKHVKVGPYRIDLVGYSVNRGRLKPSVVVELKPGQKDVVQVQNQLSRYVYHLNSDCDALLVTNEGMVWLDVKSGLPKEKPLRKQGKTYIENREDLLKIFQHVYETLTTKIDSIEIIDMFKDILLIRTYLFEDSKDRKQFHQSWRNVFDEETWTKVLHQAVEKYQLGKRFSHTYLNLDEFEILKDAFFYIHPQSPTLGEAFLEFLREVSDTIYPPYIKQIMEGILESLSERKKEKEEYLFWNYGTLFLFSKFIKNREITSINDKESEQTFLRFLTTISGYNSFYHELTQRNQKNERDKYHYCVVDTISHSHKHEEISTIIQDTEFYVKEDGYLLILLSDSYFHEDNLTLFEKTTFKLRGTINLPEHIYRPLSRKKCKLYILQKSETVSETYFQKDIQSLEKDILKTISLFKKFIKQKKEVTYVYNYALKESDYSYKEKGDWKESKQLDEIVSINSESVKINPDIDYKYIDIQSIDPSGMISTCKILKGKELPSRSRYKVRKGDILLSLLRPGGKNHYNYVAYVTDEYDGAITNINLCVIRPKKVESTLLYLYFRNAYFSKKLQSLCTGSIPRMNLSSLKELPISNELIDYNEECIGNLFEGSMSVFKNSYEKTIEKWFHTYLYKTNFDQYYLGHIATVQLGTKESFSEYYRTEEIQPDEINTYIPYIRSKNLTVDNIYIEKDHVEWIKQDNQISEDLFAKKGDILIDKTTGSLNKSLLAKEYIYDLNQFILNQHIYKIRVKDPTKIEPGYLLAYLKSSYAQLQLKEKKNRLSMKDIRNLLIPLPKKEIQQELAKQLEKQYSKKVKIEESINEIAKHWNR